MPGSIVELIDREVVAGEGDRVLQFAPPGRRRLARAGVDQIERDTRQVAGGKGERRRGFGGGMAATEEGEGVVVEGLNAEGEAIDAGQTITGEAFGFGRGRVGFEGDLDVVGEAPVAGDRIDDRADGGRRHQ